MKKTMLKKEDWGGLTIVGLLSTFLFPPYFIQLMMMAALTSFAYLWTTRLSRIEQEKLVAFEKELRVGYKLQKEGRSREALRLYRQLAKRYSNDPRISHLLSLQMQKLSVHLPTTKKNPVKRPYPKHRGGKT